MKAMKVGFIGLGTMGSSMAGNIRKGGYEMVVHDVRREAAIPHLESWRSIPPPSRGEILFAGTLRRAGGGLSAPGEARRKPGSGGRR